MMYYVNNVDSVLYLKSHEHIVFILLMEYQNLLTFT